MKTRLEEVLAGEEANYLLPFIWQRGEEEGVIREEMARIHAAGIRAVCVEARPHPDFLGERWWRDMDAIMDEARAHKMKVWVLDDDHFPTGHAAGKAASAPPALRRCFLHEHHLDVIGPQKNASFLVSAWFADIFNPRAGEGAELLAVIAARRSLDSETLKGDFLDLTGRIQEDILYWDIPEGTWRVSFLITSPRGGSERHEDYLNPLVAESTQILVDAVYEPFYQRYRADFGETFAGFFSDEPGFYNDRQAFDYNSKPGKKGVALPWCEGMLEKLEAAGGSEYRKMLPLLWHESGEQTAKARYVYMDTVSRLYGANFTQVLGDWCRAHKIEYIGHVLEDNGVHTRLGCGAGHFFRALWGQDMSGLDIVLWQVVPGMDGPFTNVSGEADGEFYHYGLAKLGSSLGHIDPKKRGRTMCELFGAYGWREGLKLMKWMTDHLLVRGVNHFVPHAFSQAEFPDPDCPPHFYARGKNPQYRYYRALNDYTNRLSHLLSGGVHVAPAAVLYHAEAEWMGEAMPFQKATKQLMQRQIDCDVLPGDALFHAAQVNGGRLVVGDESYQVLVIPACARLPGELTRRLAEFAEAGLKLVFADSLPCWCEDSAAMERLAQSKDVIVHPLEDLAGVVGALVEGRVEVEGFHPSLRCFQVRQPDLDIAFLTNEHPYDTVRTYLRLPTGGPALVYDAFENWTARLDCKESARGLEFELELGPYEGLLVASGTGCERLAAMCERIAMPGARTLTNEIPIPGPWALATASAEEYPCFSPYQTETSLHDLSQADALPKFSGTFRYETEFNLGDPGNGAVLDLGEVYETVEVWINRRRAGLRICPPYRFEVSGLLQAGRNRLVVEVTNTLVKQQRDFLSRFSHQEPSGLLGPVRLVR